MNANEITAIQGGEPLRITEKIGSTTFLVNAYFSETAKETLGDKIIRLIERECMVEHTPKKLSLTN